MADEFKVNKISEPPQPGFSRRDLLKRLGVMVGMAAFPPVLLRTRTRAQTAAGEAFVSLTPPEAETLKTLPVKDCARTFTAPIVYPATESVCPE